MKDYDRSAFETLPRLLAAHARARPADSAIICGDACISYGWLDQASDRVAAALQRDRVVPRDVIAISAPSSIDYFAVFLGALRAGVVVAPLSPSLSGSALRTMVHDCDPRRLFLSHEVAAKLGSDTDLLSRVTLLDSRPGGAELFAWASAPMSKPRPVNIKPDWAFNIIYSSGTTSAPKGIVQSHAMRWQHIRRGVTAGYTCESICLVSTPLYSNTTLVSIVAALGAGSTLVVLEKFDAATFLKVSECHRVTHAMLVPTQYDRLMRSPDFDQFDLSSYQMKFATSAPFAPELKEEVVRRWPGGLTEYYGMTEGGGTLVLQVHQRPDKLHTVGRPAPGHDIRLIDGDGRELPVGQVGEVVGHSPSMMTGYHKQPAATAEAEWYDSSGKRFIRTGDIGQFDEEGFLILKDRKKDIVISGGFNIYPSDLEAVLTHHEAVAAAAVVGVPSSRWGETPVAFVELKAGTHNSAEELRSWANSRLEVTQKLAAVHVVPQLPRSPIGKILKRELREKPRGSLG